MTLSFAKNGLAFEYNRLNKHISCNFSDILNCMINDHNCSQVCVELEGSFNCTCYSGYELQQDRATCEGN